MVLLAADLFSCVVEKAPICAQQRLQKKDEGQKEEEKEGRGGAYWG